MKCLVQNGAALNAKDKTNKTALILASEWGKIEIVKYLVEIGVDLYAKDKQGKSALDYAKSRKHFEVKRFLLEILDNSKNRSSSCLDADKSKREKRKRI